MPKMVEYLKADKGTDEETQAKSELQGALKSFDEALTKKVIQRSSRRCNTRDLNAPDAVSMGTRAHTAVVA